MKKDSKHYLDRDREHSERFLKLFATTLIATMVIAGLGLLFASMAGI